MLTAPETERAAPPLSAPAEAAPPLRPFLALLGLVTALRVVTAAAVPLSGDEAYYWTWTQHPDLGYHDHPPMVAWLVALSTAFFGNGTLAVRLPFVLMGSAVAWLSFTLCWNLRRSPCGALWAGALTLVVPLFTVAGMSVFPDSPLLLACAGFYVCAWRTTGGASSPSLTGWIASGAWAGVAVMSKLTGAFLLPALLVFLATTRAHRRLLRTPGPWVAVVTAVLVSTPFLLWNFTHGFETVAYQVVSRLGTSSARLPVQTPKFLALSAAAVSPVLFLMLIWATLRSGWTGYRQDAGTWFIFCMAAPLPTIFLALSLTTKVGLHWTAPGILASFTAFGVWMSERHTRRGARALAVCGTGLAVLVSSMVYLFALAPPTFVALLRSGVQVAGVNKERPLRTQELTEILGYPQMGAQVRVLTEQAGVGGTVPFLITTSYTLASALWFYSGQPFHVVMGSAVGAQYVHWDDFPSLLGQDALYIDTSPIDTRLDVWANLRAAFEEVTLDPPIVTVGRGVEARTFYVARCRRFRSDVFTPLQSLQRP